MSPFILSFSYSILLFFCRKEKNKKEEYKIHQKILNIINIKTLIYKVTFYQVCFCGGLGGMVFNGIQEPVNRTATKLMWTIYPHFDPPKRS